jgi:hypothetical protein
MKLVVGKLVCETEPEPAVAVLHHEGIDVESLEIASQEPVDLEVVENPFQGNDLQLEIELDDLFDWHGEGTLAMEFL